MPDRHLSSAGKRVGLPSCMAVRTRARRLLRLAILSAVILLLCACAAPKGVAPVRETTDGPAGHPGYYIVKQGDTLYSIAWRYGYDYQQVARWNGIGAPYVIHKGQRLRLAPPLRSEVVAAPPAARGAPAHPPASQPTRKEAATGQTPRATALPATGAAVGGSAGATPPGQVRWQWPTEGVVLRSFNDKQPGRKGVAIGGRLGQPVRATAPGKVVYSGSGLIGYGQLIIIKHDARYLSAYGHGRKLLVKEGDEVAAGQVIAEMGTHGTDGAMLHFEIRDNGKPVDPLRLLPRR
jgi:lipoprotein NlpD